MLENFSASHSSGIHGSDGITIVKNKQNSNEKDKRYCNSDDEYVIEDHCKERSNDIRPYKYSYLNKKCHEKVVIVCCDALPLQNDDLIKFTKNKIDDLNIDNELKQKFFQMIIKKNFLTPLQRHLIPLITDDKRNIHISYEAHCGAKSGILVGIVEQVKRMKKELKTKRTGPFAIIVTHNYKKKAKNSLSKLKQLLVGSNITCSFNNTDTIVDIAILPVNTFCEGFEDPSYLDNLSIFCIFDGERVLKEAGQSNFEKRLHFTADQNDFVVYVLMMIKNNVRIIILTNRMTGGQRSNIFDMVKSGSLSMYNPDIHNA